MCPVHTEPDLFASEEGTHARERKPEVSQRLSVTRMHDVYRLRCFSNDRETELARRRGTNGRETRQLLTPQLVLLRARDLSQQRQIVIHREHPDDIFQTAAQKRDAINEWLEQLG